MPGLAEKGKYIPAGINVGNSRVVAAVAYDTGSSIPAAVAACPTVGMRRGVITDPESLARCVADAVQKVEKSVGVKVSAARVGFTGYTVEFIPVEVEITATGIRRVNQGDLDRLKRIAALTDILAGKQILQVIPMDFVVDSSAGIKTPLGMKFKTLKLNARLLIVDSKLIDSLTDVMGRVSLKPTGFVPSSLAAAGEAMTASEMHLGTALLDLGAATTGLTVYNYGCQLGFTLLPVGGDHISGDLAVGLRTTLEAAGGIGKRIGLEIKTDAESFEVPGINGSGNYKIDCEFAKKIIDARVGEILDMAKTAIRKMAGDVALPGGVVLTGGGAALRGLEKFAAEYLDMPVRLAVTKVPGPDGKVVEDHSCTAAVGLLQKDEFDLKYSSAEAQQRGVWKSLIGYLRTSERN